MTFFLHSLRRRKVAQGGGSIPPSRESQTKTFTIDTTTNFLNPERGWHSDRASTGDFSGLRGGSWQSTPMTLNRWIGRLDEFRDSAISQNWLNNHANVFAAARSAGIKLELRYAYSYNPPTNPPDASATRIVQHIGQLGPVWQANADVISSIQAGFVGRWGEWNASGFGITSGADPAVRNSIIQALVDNVPTDRMITLRYPEMTAEYFGHHISEYPDYPAPVTFSERFNGTPKARLGILNDSFLANHTDGGTFVVNRYTANYATNTHSMAYWVATSRYTANSGETVDLDWRDGNRESGAASIARMAELNWDVLNRAYSTRVINGWIASGHYDEISRRLGYRLGLTSVTLPEDISSGASFDVSFTLKNDGFGKVFNPRPIDLVLTPTGGGDPVSIRLVEDARRDLPLGGETRTLAYTVNLPGDVAGGSYTAALALPDPYPSIANDSRYAIRLANDGVWNNGINELGMTVNVVAGGGGGGDLLLGTGSPSNSLSLYPKTPATTTGNIYVSTFGSNSNSGTFSQPVRTISHALTLVSAGQTILVRGGVYNEAINRTSRSWATPVRVMAYGDEVPRIDGGGAQRTLRFNNVHNEHWCGFEIVGGVDYGIRLDSSTNIKLERMYVHDSATNEYGVGIMLSHSDNNIIQDCAVWGLGTPGMGGTDTPDSYALTASSGSTCTGNVVVRCVAANSTDDNFDMFRATDCTFLDCVSIAAGYYYNGDSSSSEGNGFKLGGSANSSGNTTRGCIAVHSKKTAFNSNSAPYISYINSTAADNSVGIRFMPQGATGYAEEALVVNNSTNIYSDQYQVIPPPERLVRNSWTNGVTSGNVNFADPSTGDYSLLGNSAAVTLSSTGGAIGASTVALEILKTWWNHSGIYVPGRGAGSGAGLPGESVPPNSGGGSGGGGGEPQTISYTVDSTSDFLNPERGWMTRGGDVTFNNARNSQSGSNHHNIGYSVMWNDSSSNPWNGTSGNPFHLGNYQGSGVQLPQSLLNAVENYFAQARSAGIKIKVRFFYRYGSGPSITASQATMVNHVNQLAPIITANSDVVASLDAGMVGDWGEMAGNQGTIDAVTTAWMSQLPSWMTVATRMPRYVRSLYPSWNIPYSERFTTNQSRLGGFNDCFVANPLQGASYLVPDDKPTFAAVSRFTCFSGETCQDTAQDFSHVYRATNAIPEMETVHMDLLYRGYWTGAYNHWISSGHYPEISRRLGYRIHMTSATLPTTAARGSTANVSFNMTNTGFGKVYNPRPIDLVLVPSSGAATTIRLTSDARRDLPLAGESQTLSYNFTVPQISTGSYAMYLVLPDQHESIQNDTRYHIRLANQGTWVSATGRNNLNANITIT